jgi:hypothetical protein
LFARGFSAVKKWPKAGVLTVSSLPDTDDVESQLTPQDRRGVLQRIGFDFSDSHEGSSGWTQKVAGPSELGEGSNPNFAIHLSTGAITDHGSGANGWSGDFWDAVQDVKRCGFREALEFVCQRAGIDMEDTASETADWSPFDG